VFGLSILMSFTGRRRPVVKEEPKSPAQPTKKRKAYSATDTSTIGRLEIIGSDNDTPQPTGKRHKAFSGASSQVRFDGIVVPPAPVIRPTRKSTRTAKANSKKDLRELFERLGQEFGAVAKTCEDIAEAFE
jgi:hypothetical protein